MHEPTPCHGYYSQQYPSNVYYFNVKPLHPNRHPVQGIPIASPITPTHP